MVLAQSKICVFVAFDVYWYFWCNNLIWKHIWERCKIWNIEVKTRKSKLFKLSHFCSEQVPRQEKWTAIRKSDSRCFGPVSMSSRFTNLQSSKKYRVRVKCRPLGSKYWSDVNVCYVTTNVLSESRLRCKVGIAPVRHSTSLHKLNTLFCILCRTAVQAIVRTRILCFV